MTVQDSLRVHAMRGVAWSLAERWLVRAIGLGLLVVLARLLGPEAFGLVAAASIVVDFVGLFVATGFSNYLVQANEIDETLKSTALVVALAVGSVLALLVVLTAPLVAQLLGEDALTPLIRVLSISLVVGSAAGVPTGLILRRLEFRHLFARSVSATVISGAVAVGLAVGGAGAWSLVGQTVTFTCVNTVAVWIGARWRPTMVFSWSHAGAILRFSLNITGIAFLAFMRNRGEVFLVATLRDPVALGVWVVGRRIVNVVAELFAGVMARVATPVFARAKADTARLQRGYVSSVILTAAMGTPLLFVIAAIAPLGVPLLFGEEWSEAAYITSFMALGFIPAISTYLNRGLFVALGRTGLEFKFMVFTASSQLALAAAVLIAGGSLTTLSVALAAREVVSWPIRLWTVRRVVQIDTTRLTVALLRVWFAGSLSGGLAWAISARMGGVWPDGWVVLCAATIAGVMYLPLLRLINRHAYDELVQAFTAGTRALRRTGP